MTVLSAMDEKKGGEASGARDGPFRSRRYLALVSSHWLLVFFTTTWPGKTTSDIGMVSGGPTKLRVDNRHEFMVYKSSPPITNLICSFYGFLWPN